MKLQPLNHRQALPILALVLLVTSQLPSRWSGWLTGTPRDLVDLLVSPVSQTVDRIVLASGYGAVKPSDQGIDLVQEDRDQLYRLLRRYEQELEEARRTIEDLSRVRQSVKLWQARFQIAAVTGRFPDPISPRLTINRGQRDGLRVGQVVASGMHLVGRVSHVGPATSQVDLIIAPGTLLRVNIMPVAIGPAPRQTVAQISFDRNMSAFTAVVSVSEKESVQIGDLAHLLVEDDPLWPRDARGFVVGRVSRVEKLPENPFLQQRMIVEPMRELIRLSEVYVVVPEPWE